MHCKICNEEREVQTPGSYAHVLTCGHLVTNIPTHEIIKQGANPTQAEEIQKKVNKTQELPAIDTQEVVTRALSGMKQNSENFFTSENQLIEDLIKEHGADQAVLIFTSIHSHMSHVLFTMSRFRNLYFTAIERIRKDIEDKAVKDLVQNHDFYYKDLDQAKNNPPKPRKLKIGTDIDKAKESMKGLLDKDGKPIDVTKVLAALMWKKTPEQIAQEKIEAEELAKQKELDRLAKEARKASYKNGLSNIIESITKKDDIAS